MFHLVKDEFDENSDDILASINKMIADKEGEKRKKENKENKE